MIFQTVDDYNLWSIAEAERRNITGPVIPGTTLELQTEKSLELNIWKVQKARELVTAINPESYVMGIVMGHDWITTRNIALSEALPASAITPLGILTPHPSAARNLQDANNLIENLGSLCDHYIILDANQLKLPVSEIPKIWAAFEGSDYGPIGDRQREQMRGCFAISYLFTKLFKGKGFSHRVYFVHDGPMFLYGARPWEGRLLPNRQPLVCTEILREPNGLPKSNANENRIDLILELYPTFGPEIDDLHNQAMAYVDGKSVTLTSFDLDTVHSLAFAGPPLPAGVLYEVIFRLKPELLPTYATGMFLKDVIYDPKARLRPVL